MSPARAERVALSGRTSFRVGGEAIEFHEPRSLPDLRRVLATLDGRRPFFLGGGSNTLFPDGPFERPVVSTNRLRALDLSGNVLRAEAGVRLGRLIGRSIEAGLGGLEGLVGIPGTAGGAAVMNAGGGGVSFGDRVRALGLVSLDGTEGAVLRGRDVPWAYRSWGLEGYLVAWVELELSPDRVEALRERARELFRRKRRTQPLGSASAGCIFKNPPGGAAAELIDSLGLKGMRRGGAEVSAVHANFIVNRQGMATARDVRELIEAVRERVREARGVSLETEVVLAAEDDG